MNRVAGKGILLVETGGEHMLKDFFKSLRKKKIACLGIGVSHLDVIRLFAQKGAAVTACDKRSREELGETARELESLGVALKLGNDYLENIDAEMVLRTPGMKWSLPQLVSLRERGVNLTSEMELFFGLCPCPIIAVTGSDGKTTTTTLIAEMLRAGGGTVHLGGNIGRALLPVIEEINPEDAAVVELSSFQLISMRRSPAVAVVTNISPNHLDWHSDMEEYINAKKNILRYQSAEGRAVLCRDGENCREFAHEAKGSVAWFSMKEPVENGAFLRDRELFLARGGIEEKIVSASEIRLPGEHNIANVLAAIAAAQGLAGTDAMRRVAREFAGVEHRIEFVRELDGVKWFNDSIASSPTRTIAGLRTLGRNLVIIAGGRDKGVPFDAMAPEICSRVRLLILAGEAAGKIEAAVLACADYAPGSPEIIRAADIPEAVQIARERTAPGDIVSLSPACTSFDRYANFEERGKHFKRLVGEL